MPLSEEEQRILQEMEQKLREHDRDFVDRVSHTSYRLRSSRGAKWAALGFFAGAALLLGTFRVSIALGICGVLVMLVSALGFVQQMGMGGTTGSLDHDSSDHMATQDARQRPGAEQQNSEADDRRPRPARSSGIAEEWSEMRRRMRSRFGHRD